MEGASLRREEVKARENLVNVFAISEAFHVRQVLSKMLDACGNRP